MGAIEFITPHILTIAGHRLVHISMVCSYDHLKLFLGLIVFDSENSILVQFHEFRLELLLRFYLVFLFVKLVLHVKVVRVHVLK